MAHVPHNAKWYWAEIIEEINVEGDSRNVVHRNLVLIRADSPTEAYEKAIEIGNNVEGSYENPDRALVRTTFRGLGGLDVIHDDLEHGAEILYQENVAVSQEELEGWVRRKDQLALFRDETGQDSRPDYGSKEVVEEVRKMIKSEPG